MIAGLCKWGDHVAVLVGGLGEPVDEEDSSLEGEEDGWRGLSGDIVYTNERSEREVSSFMVPKGVVVGGLAGRVFEGHFLATVVRR